MKVTNIQIESLYTFTRKHFVEWYDVQTELVDHLANGIEEQWQEKPKLTFDEALKNEFNKFGVFGFSEIVEQKTRALETYYRKEVWHCLKDYFKLPKIILTSFSVWALFEIFQLFENKEYVAVSLMLFVLCFYFLYTVKESKRIKTIQKQTGKKWLFESVISQLGGFIYLLNIGIYMPIINFDRQWDPLAQWSFSLCFIIYNLLLYVSIKVVSPYLKEKLSKEHPEYKLV
jgi:hypothetical protein